MAQPRNAVQTDRGRLYKWGPTGETFTSVTTILNAIAKPALTNWAAKSVAEYVVANLEGVMNVAENDPAAAIDLMKGSPWRQRDAAANLGTHVHDAIEAKIIGKPYTPPEKVRTHMGHFLAFVADFAPEFLMAEATVFCRRYGWAGTLDSIAVIDGETYIIDVKTGKDVYPEVGLQLAAYAYGEFVGMPDGTEQELPDIDKAAVLHITADGYRLMPVRADEEMYRLFLYAAQVRRFMDEVARSVVGAPVPAPAKESRPSPHPNVSALVD